MKTAKAVIEFGKQEVVVDVPEYIEILEIQTNNLHKIIADDNTPEHLVEELENLFCTLYGIIQEHYLYEGAQFIGYDEDEHIANGMLLKNKDKRNGISYRYKIEEL